MKVIDLTPVKPCDKCNGQTGLHEFGCPNMDTRVQLFLSDSADKLIKQFYLGLDSAIGEDRSAVVAIEDGKVVYVEEQLTHAQMVEMVRFLERENSDPARRDFKLTPEGAATLKNILGMNDWCITEPRYIDGKPAFLPRHEEEYLLRRMLYRGGRKYRSASKRLLRFGYEVRHDAPA